MESCIQFSVFLANKPGVFSQVFSELAKAKVNVTALTMMDSVEHGVLRMIVSDPKQARSVFKQLNIPVTEAEVLAVTLPNKPGAAADLCDRLSKKKINIAYMYCTGGVRGRNTVVMLRVPDIKKAIKAIDGNRAPRRDMKIKLRRPTTRKKKRG